MSDATLSEALAALRARPEWLDGLLADEVVLWLGSGISRARFPMLTTLLENLLDELWRRAEAGDERCGKALEQLRWKVTPWRKAASGSDPATWPQRREGLGSLAEDYAEVLDLIARRVGRDRLLFELLNLEECYGRSDIEPDAEHRFVALLHSEGLAQEVVTTNWDALVEAAAEELEGAISGGTEALAVAAAPEDLETFSRLPRLLKIHGCARLSLGNPGRYRPFFVATDSQVERWSDARAPTEPFRAQIRASLQNRGSVVLGLSFQDSNLRRQVREAADAMRAGGASDSFRLVVAGGRASDGIQQLVDELAAERSEEDSEHLAKEIVIPLWAKPFLGAAYVETLLRKARSLDHQLEDAFRPLLIQGLTSWERHLADRYDADIGPDENNPDAEARWRRLARELPAALSRSLELFGGRIPEAGAKAPHRPLSQRPPGDIDIAERLAERGLHRGVLALAALGEGQMREWWSLSPPSEIFCQERKANQEQADEDEAGGAEATVRESDAVPCTLRVNGVPVALVQDSEAADEVEAAAAGSRAEESTVLCLQARGRRRGWSPSPRRVLGHRRLPSYGLDAALSVVSLRSEMEQAANGEAYLVRLREILRDAAERLGKVSVA